MGGGVKRWGVKHLGGVSGKGGALVILGVLMSKLWFFLGTVCYPVGSLVQFREGGVSHDWGFLKYINWGVLVIIARAHVHVLFVVDYLQTDTPFDFRTPTAIGERINEADRQLQLGHGYDHNWCLNKSGPGALDLAAVVTEPSSGVHRLGPVPNCHVGHEQAHQHFLGEGCALARFVCGS